MRWQAYARPLPLLGLCAALILLGASPWGLWERDEGRYANVAQEMLARGDVITPRLGGVVFLDKPPLVYWVTAASLALWGHGEQGARFGQLLFALGTLIATYLIGLAILDRRRALAAVMVLASSAAFFVSAHTLTLDLGLAFFVCLTMLCFVKGYRGGGSGRAWYRGMFAAIAGGVLCKGLVGAVLPGMTIAVFLLLRGQWRRLREMRWAEGVPIFLVLTVPWFLAVERINPGFLSYFFVHEHLARFTTQVHHREGGPSYYLGVMAVGLLPWTLLVPLRLPWRSMSARRLPALAGREAPALLLSWLVTGIAFFTLSQSKLPLYILPVFPAAALILAALLDRTADAPGAAGPARFLPAGLIALLAAAAGALWWRQAGLDLSDTMRWGVKHMPPAAGLAAAALIAGLLPSRRVGYLTRLGATALIWMAACLAALTILGRTSYFNETKRIASVLASERRRGDDVYAYRCYLRGLPFYLREDVGLVSVGTDDLSIGRNYPHDPGLDLDEEGLLGRLRGDRRIFVVVEREELEPLQRRVGRPLYILARARTHDLVSNRLASGNEAVLGRLLDQGGIDPAATAAMVPALVPGGIVEMVEVEQGAGGAEFCIVVSRAGAHYEIRVPLGGAEPAALKRFSPIEESGAAPEPLLRLAPPDPTLANLAAFLRTR